MSEWQPIATAPKDGTVILIYGDEAMTTAYWRHIQMGRDGYWALWCAGSYAEDDEVNATHWMPLPEPPK